MARLNGRRQRVVAIIAIMIAISGAVVLAEYHSGNRPLGSNVTLCNSLIPNASSYFETGLTPVCGAGQASDGRLNITVHNYYFAQEKDVLFQFASNEQTPLPYEVFMFVNVTVVNVGGGNTSIGAGWEAVLLNGTSPVNGVTNFIANATFASYPNRTIPDYEGECGCFFLPPGSRVDFWVIFYVPFGTHVVSTNINQAQGFKLKIMMYRELGYGGIWIGYGGFNCQKVACQEPDVQFIIKT